jgi:hypothetical protein
MIVYIQLIMATYGEFYFKLLEKISSDYQSLHNLSTLDQF